MSRVKEWIYITGEDNQVRYALGYKGQRTIVCMGINPSTASPDHPDPTIGFVEKIAEANGYDSFLMINVYPMRDTVFKDLPDEENKEYGATNLEIIKRLFNELPQPIDVWLAYGDHVDDMKTYMRPCLEELLDALKEYDIRYKCAGTNKSGNPKHPLYLKGDTKLVDYTVPASEM